MFLLILTGLRIPLCFRFRFRGVFKKNLMNTCDFIWKLFLFSRCEELTSRSPSCPYVYQMCSCCAGLGRVGGGGGGVHYELWAYLTRSNDCRRWVVKLSAVQIKLRCYAAGPTSVPKSLLLCSVQRATSFCSPGKAPLPPGSLIGYSRVKYYGNSK